MEQFSNIAILLLAAGESRRLGKPKQLVKFKGKTLLQHSIDVASGLNIKEQYIVLGANRAKILAETQLRAFKPLNNVVWKVGMAGSLRLGLNSIQELDHVTDVLVILSDQPYVNKELMHDLISKHLETKSLATFSEYKNIPGVPAIFSRALFHKLQELQGDKGARQLIENGLTNFQLVPFEQGIIDIDTEKDLHLLKLKEHEN